ncbi:unnamed protein product [Mytilus edulis]|uniref:Retrotransposon gag domain-containing protein n=1 Tax=Mytilus edulis TaxID=6550 RepID=A0A8S3VAY6_MYTED|nr:unnamed protein product [Mytilus edulis]
MGRTRKTRNRSLSPAPSVSVVRTPISSTPHERRDLPETKSQVTPSKFFGDVGEDFESWIKIFDRISRANRWSDGRKGEMLPAYLRGRAADYFEDLDSEIQNDFDTAVQKLKQRFCPKELERMYYSKLFQRKQFSGESVEDYGNAILKLARRAHGGVSLDEHDSVIPARVSTNVCDKDVFKVLNPTTKPVIKLFKDTNIGTFEEIDELSDEEPLPEDPYTTFSLILYSDVSDNEILIDEEEHLDNLDKTFCDISNNFQLGDDIISISDTLTFGDMNSSSHVIIDETIITIIID